MKDGPIGKEKGHGEELAPIACEWHIVAFNVHTGEIVHEEKDFNVIVVGGKEEMLKLMFNISGSPFIAMGAGEGSTAATVNDTRLETELIANATRKSLTKTDGSTPLTVETEVTTIGANTYHRKLVSRASFLSGDSNNGDNFREYALFTTATLPGTPTSTSGVMFNRYVAASNIAKDSSIQINVDTTVRF